MDFITDLPPSKRHTRVYDSIFVVIDRFTKMARYIPVTKTVDAPELAEVFVTSIFKDFGAPEGITSDRGSQFTSKFWSTFCFMLKVRRRLSTAFRPQTDGQTERQNQTIEHYLRCYCAYRQDDWAKKLALAEFSYNNSVHSTTGVSPFYACYGYHPTIDVGDDVPEGEAPAARERAETLRDEREVLTETLRSATEQQTKYYNLKHKPRRFKINQKVMLMAKNIRQLRPNRKLSDRYLGPFVITEAVGEHGQAYRLKLPQSMKVHDVFHVSLLEPWEERDGIVTELEPVLIAGEPEWEVESIQNHRDTRKGREYLVRWKGFTPAEDTWEPRSHVDNAEEALREYWRASNRGEVDREAQRRRRRR